MSTLRFAFTDRWGGVSRPPYAELNLAWHVGDEVAAVRENRRLAAAKLGLGPAGVVWMRQVHGADVAVADAPFPDGEEPAVDGVVSVTAGLALAVQVADCTPVLLGDPVAGVVGAAHAGRGGLAAGVVPATVAAMRRLGADPARTVAATGPAICGRCYEVPEELAAEVAALVPAARSETRRATPALDIPAGVWAQLEGIGIGAAERSPVCTLESFDHYSYRREGRTGRHAGYVWMEP